MTRGSLPGTALVARESLQVPITPLGKLAAAELRERNLPTLPFDRVLLDLLDHARLVKRVQIINGLAPDLLARAFRGERVGTIVRKDEAS